MEMMVNEVTMNRKMRFQAPVYRNESLAQPKPLYDIGKRLFDLLVAVICLTVGLPVYLVIALIVVIDDPGNPLFFQERIGKDGKPFTIVKFRTMCKNAEEIKHTLIEQNESDGVHFKIKHDPRITNVGRFLRRTSLDETPQAINLLTGSMSVIGPRAFIRSEQDALPMDRLQVKPGLSCYWQVEHPVDLGIEDQLEYDYRYIRERSMKTDFKIIGMTILSILHMNNS